MTKMAAAMFVPVFPLLALMWLGALSFAAVLPPQMMLMLPSMILVMLPRFDEYAGHTTHKRPVASAAP